MSKFYLSICITLVFFSNVCFAEKPHGPKPEIVNVSLGSKQGSMQFSPHELTFERGKYYKLVINNPSSEDHYFTSDAFSTHIFTRKVEVVDKAGSTIAEIHGAINDMELKPGAAVEWYFYPMSKGKDLKLFCHKKGHEAAGMVGKINIIGPPPFSK
jgi:uncharacterized cupredoxin-like copper-binding protein